jgi:DNA-binding CsgD family transcriptional regulator
MLIVGEPGIGKTRILEELAAAARADGWIVLQGSSFEGEWSPPFGPFAAALAEFIDRSDAKQLTTDLGSIAPVVAQLVPSLGNRLQDIGEAAPLPPEEEQFRLLDSVSQFLITLSLRSRVLLILDDLHWADRSSLQMLRHVARNARRRNFLILGAHRESAEQGVELPEFIAALRRESGLEQLHLSRVDADASAQLIRSLEPNASSELVASVTEEADGNPFFIRELVFHLTEEWADRPKHVEAAAQVPSRVPESIRQVIEKRLRRLAPGTRAVLTSASAVAGPLRFDVLASACDLDEAAITEAFDEAIAAQMLRLSSDGDTCEFVHALTRHTLYSSISPPRRARVHRRIAEAMERIGEGDGFAADIAYHYRRSIVLPDAGRGCKFALIAADEAQRANAPERAVEFLRIANELSARAPVAQRADIARRLAIAEGLALRSEEAARTARIALNRLDEAGAAPTELVGFLAAFTRVQKIGGAARKLWEPFAFEGLERTREDHDLDWARLTLLFNPFETVSTGLIHAARSVGYSPEAVSIARSLGNADDYLSTIGITEVRTREETELVRKAVESWATGQRREGLCVVGHDLLNRHGEFREARDLFRALVADQHAGSITWQAFAWIQLAVAEASLGSFGEAQRAAASADTLLRRIPQAHIARFYEFWLSFVLAYYMDGDWRTIAKLGAALASYRYSILTAPLFAAEVAVASVRIGDVETARRYLAELVGVLEQTGAQAWHQHGALIVAVDALWELANSSPEARTDLTPLASRYQALTMEVMDSGVGDIAVGSLSLTIARLNALKSEYRSTDFARARADAERGGQEPLRAIVDHDEAIALLTGSSSAEQAMSLLEAAQTRFGSMRLEWWSNRAHMITQLRRKPSRPGGLTPREVEVLQLLASGMSSGEIARELSLSIRTVGRHITNIYSKIGARGRADATAYAIRHLPAASGST